MSSTKSRISSGPTKAGTHHSSKAQRSRRRSLYFGMNLACRVGEIVFQCRLAPVVISKRVWIEASLWWIKMEFERQYVEFGGKEVCHQDRRNAWCRVKWSKGVLMLMQNEIEGRKSRPRSADGDCRSAYAAELRINAEQRRMGRKAKSLEWNRGPPDRGWGGDSGAPIFEEERGQKRQYRAQNEISKRQSRLRRSEGIEERRWGLRSTGVLWRPPTGMEERRL